MKPFIRAVKEQCIIISNNLNAKFPNMDILYGGIFYRDPVDQPNEIHEFQNLDDSSALKKKMEKIKAYGGGDTPEDWVGAYKILLNEIKWREGSKKLVFHLADAGAHGLEFSIKDEFHNLYEESTILKDLIIECAKNNISIIGYKIGKHPEMTFNKCKEFFDQNKNESSYYKILEFPTELLHGDDMFKNLSDKFTVDVSKSTEAFILFSRNNVHG